MKKFLAIVFVFFFFCIIAIPVNATDFDWHMFNQIWLPVYIHYHTNNSDGARTITMTVKKIREIDHKNKYLILTDHLDQLITKSGEKFQDYIKDCNWFSTSDYQFVVIPGVEVSEKWIDDQGKKNYSHTLVCIFGRPERLKELLDCTSQKELLQKAKEIYGVTISAHPCMIAHVVWGVGEERFLYQTSLENCQGLNYVEFFNSYSLEQEVKTMAFYCQFLKNHLFIGATAGADSHGPIKNDAERWQRVTWINIFQEDGICDAEAFQALHLGRTYATAHGLKVTMNQIPCQKEMYKKDYHIDNPDFHLKFNFKPSLEKDVVCSVYKDGVEITSSRKTIKKGAVEINYDWTDSNPTSGENWYVIYIPEYFVTSPMIYKK